MIGAQKGEVVLACSKMLVAECNALTVEFLALREALELVSDLGLVVGSMETDSSNEIHALDNLR